MRSPGIRLHNLALLGWAVVITAVLLLLSLPVLAGKIQILPALNLAICWKLWYINLTQSAGNLSSLHFLGILRDCTPEFICCIVLGVSLQVDSFGSSTTARIKKHDLKYYTDHALLVSRGSNLNIKFAHYIAGLIEGDGTIHVPKTVR